MLSGIAQNIFPYVGAWARHGVFIALASGDAAARGGLNDGDEAALFGVARVEVPPYGAVPRSSRITADAVDVVIEDETLVYRFPYHYPDRAHRGEMNADFLNPQRFLDRVAPVLDLFGERARLVMLRPAPLYRTEEIAFEEILERLDRFLAHLPAAYRYVLEPPAPMVLRREYFDCLHARGVVHMFSEGEALFRALPSVGEQLFIPGAVAPPFCVVRSGFPGEIPGMPHRRFDGALRRQGWYDAVCRCLVEHLPVYLFVDDGTNPLDSLMALMEMLNEDLAKRSVLRQNAA